MQTSPETDTPTESSVLNKITLDVETTGLDPRKDKLTLIGWREHGKSSDILQFRCDTKERVGKEAFINYQQKLKYWDGTLNLTSTSSQTTGTIVNFGNWTTLRLEPSVVGPEKTPTPSKTKLKKGSIKILRVLKI